MKSNENKEHMKNKEAKLQTKKTTNWTACPFFSKSFNKLFA